MSSRSPPKKPISERISIFEKPNNNGGSMMNGSPIMKQGTPGKNISALKSQFSSGDPSKKTPPSKDKVKVNASSPKAPVKGPTRATPPATAPTKTSSPPRQMKKAATSPITPSPSKKAAAAKPVKSSGSAKVTATRSSHTAEIIRAKVPTVTVTVESALPPTPLTDPAIGDSYKPVNKNEKETIESYASDNDVINANFIKNRNMSVSDTNNNHNNNANGSNRYWTNQALQNDNSQTISEALKLDLEFKDEKISALNKELEELHSGGATEEELASVKRQKNDLDARLKDQEEELDDLAGQVQMLEQSKTKLEMSIAAQKKEHRRELSIKEDELEDARSAAQKKVKALEQQLESEHEERIRFVREKHDLETKIMNLQELASRSADEDQVIKLKKDLKRTKALLKDAQCMLEKSRSESSNKIVLRQLKNQLEDSEFARTAALKARQNTEMELADVQQQLDDVIRTKNDLEDKFMRINREKCDAASQLEDSEEELQDIMKKYKAAVSQLSVDQITITQQSLQLSEMEEERLKLKESLHELTSKIDNLESDNMTNAANSRLELKIREMESKLELEQTTRGRMETQINRLKEAIEKLNHECDVLRNKEFSSQEQVKKLQRSLRDAKEDYANLQQKETEINAKKIEFEKQFELAEAETITAKNDLKIALKRIEDLQTAIHGELSSESDAFNSDCDSDSSDEGMDTFLEHHRRAVSVQRERESVSREIYQRDSTRSDSIARETSISKQRLETMSELPEETTLSENNNENLVLKEDDNEEESQA